MARNYARIFTSIWADESFRALSIEAQGLYFRILTDAQLSMCGVMDWRPAKLATCFKGMTKARLEKIADELDGARFLVIDRDTEEVLARSFVRHDGVLKSPNMTKAMAGAWSSTGSLKIREAVVSEVSRFYETEPDAKGRSGLPDWFKLPEPNQSGTESKGFHVGSDPVPSEDPNPSRHVPLDIPDPVTSNQQPERGASTDAPPPKQKKGTRLPEDWLPSDDVRQAMLKELPHVDFRSEHLKFSDHWKAQSGAKGVKSDWDAVWRNWMRRAPEFAPRHLRAVGDSSAYPDEPYVIDGPPPEMQRDGGLFD